MAVGRIRPAKGGEAGAPATGSRGAITTSAKQQPRSNRMPGTDCRLLGPTATQLGRANRHTHGEPRTHQWLPSDGWGWAQGRFVAGAARSCANVRHWSGDRIGHRIRTRPFDPVAALRSEGQRAHRNRCCHNPLSGVALLAGWLPAQISRSGEFRTSTCLPNPVPHLLREWSRFKRANKR